MRLRLSTIFQKERAPGPPQAERPLDHHEPNQILSGVLKIVERFDYFRSNLFDVERLCSLHSDDTIVVCLPLTLQE